MDITDFNYSNGDYVKANRLAWLENWVVLISNKVNELWERIEIVLWSTWNEYILLKKEYK